MPGVRLAQHAAIALLALSCADGPVPRAVVLRRDGADGIRGATSARGLEPVSPEIESAALAVAEIRRSEVGVPLAWTAVALDDAAGEVSVDPSAHRETYRNRYGPEPMALRITPPLVGRVRLPDGVDWVMCGGPRAEPLPIRWETLSQPQSSATPLLSVADGWFDPATCSASATRRAATPVRAVAWGTARARLAAEPGDAGAARESLVLLLPRAHLLETSGEARVDPGAVTHVTLPLDAVTPTRVALLIGVIDLDRFRVGLGPMPRSMTRAGQPDPGTPTVRVYIERDPLAFRARARAASGSGSDVLARLSLDREWLQRCQCARALHSPENAQPAYRKHDAGHSAQPGSPLAHVQSQMP
jgi:hypothetical protein